MNLKISFKNIFQNWVHPALPQKNFRTSGVLKKKRKVWAEQMAFVPLGEEQSFGAVPVVALIW